MAKLINGNGNPAIYAAEDADLIASLTGNVTCISNVGNKYAATEEDATTIRLDDGVIITKEGRRIQLEAGKSDTFYIPTGTSGQTNYYIIGYKLVQNADSTQVAEQFVQKMNSSSETITEDTFRSGAIEVYVSVYRVTQVGFTIDSVDRLLPELLDSASIKEDIEQINSDLSNKQDKLTNPLTRSNIINNLTSTSSTDVLSAAQGKVLNDDLEGKINNFTEKTTFDIYESGLYDVYAIGPAIGYAAHYTVINHVVGSGFITQLILSLTYGKLYSRTCFGNVWSEFQVVPNMDYLYALTAVSTDSTKGTLVHFDDTKGKAFMLIDGEPWYFTVSRT